MKIADGLSAWCLLLWKERLFHAKVEYAGRGKFRVKEEHAGQSILKGMTVDASNIISWNLAPG